MADRSHNRVLSAGLLLGLLVLAGCGVPQPGSDINDPFEQSNRRVHDFNIGVDRAILRPAGQLANKAPEIITGPVVNFSNNVSLPGMVVNNVLQGDIGGTVTNTMRFLLNSTVGVLGLFDPAGAIGITEQKTDFGETLAVWGVGEGPYIELPLLGPSTARDAVGQVVDFALDPLSQVGLQSQIDYGTYARIGEKVIDRGEFGDTLDSILYDSADSYAQARLIYLQNRRYELGETATDAYIDPYAQ